MSDLTLDELLSQPRRFAAWLRSLDDTISFHDTRRTCPLARWLDAERGDLVHIVKVQQVERVGGFDVVPLPLWGVEFISIFDDLAIQNGNIERWWVFASEIISRLDTMRPDWWEEAHL